MLAATSGGVDVGGLGGRDWRPEYRAVYPGAADWVYAVPADLTAQIRAIAAPTLLLRGEADRTSPVAVGRRLAGLLPDATLQGVIPRRRLRLRRRPARRGRAADRRPSRVIERRPPARGC